ncbi:cupin domain-containing protein [Frateuria sp. GZRR35]|uniref:cupin domain-containing protein n=1 Tax=Frateuria sp. GZRR35 TaxID=3351536 RepID=UPI003EDBBFDD
MAIAIARVRGRRPAQARAHEPAPYAEETHDCAEALLVLDGELRLHIGGTRRVVHAGELCLVPAGVAHAVDAGSTGTLLIMDA